MVYDGFVAITDPLREDVFAAVKHCRSAGIDLKMLTGDNIVTATAIANDLGILDNGHIAVEAGGSKGNRRSLRKCCPKSASLPAARQRSRCVW